MATVRDRFAGPMISVDPDLPRAANEAARCGTRPTSTAGLPLAGEPGVDIGPYVPIRGEVMPLWAALGLRRGL
jgi:hypothetical protein